jgi:class 3 adenylate cyclase
MSIATFLFTDVANSTEHVLRLGDERWAALLSTYRSSVRRELREFNGSEVDAAGDGFFAVFADASSAINCARELDACTRRLGLPSRTAVHTGDCQPGGEKVSGINVHVAARILTCAQPGQVLVSDRVSVSGTSVRVLDAGVHALKCVPGKWQLYRAG